MSKNIISDTSKLYTLGKYSSEPHFFICKMNIDVKCWKKPVIVIITLLTFQGPHSASQPPCLMDAGD